MVRKTEFGSMTGHGPADQKTVRRHNLGLVLGNIVKGGRRSRAKISTETGLNPSTVSSLIGDLIEWGLLYEVGVEQDGSIGRPGRSLELNPTGGAALGIEIGDDGVSVLALDLASTVRYRAFVGQDNSMLAAPDVVAQASALAKEALKSFRNADIPHICTIALPGLVGADGVLLQAPNIHWNNVPIMDLWRDCFGDSPTAIDNDARLAAYAEMTLGIAQDIQTFAYVSGGTGIGSGLVLNRTIYRGAHGFAGEFGHTTIDRSGLSSSWGAPGSLQAVASERALLQAARLSILDRHARSDPDWIGRETAQRARADDPSALAALEEVGHALGVGIANLYNLFDMEAIVLGGYFTHVAEWLTAPIFEELQSRVNAERYIALPVLFSDMGHEAAVRGAAARSLDLLLERAANEEAPFS